MAFSQSGKVPQSKLKAGATDFFGGNNQQGVVSRDGTDNVCDPCAVERGRHNMGGPGWGAQQHQVPGMGNVGNPVTHYPA